MRLLLILFLLTWIEMPFDYFSENFIEYGKFIYLKNTFLELILELKISQIELNACYCGLTK